MKGEKLGCNAVSTSDHFNHPQEDSGKLSSGTCHILVSSLATSISSVNRNERYGYKGLPSADLLSSNYPRPLSYDRQDNVAVVSLIL